MSGMLHHSLKRAKSLSEKLEIIADKILLVQTIEIFLAESSIIILIMLLLIL
jgi:hypothetical protein